MFLTCREVENLEELNKDNRDMNKNVSTRGNLCNKDDEGRNSCRSKQVSFEKSKIISLYFTQEEIVKNTDEVKIRGGVRQGCLLSPM